MKTYEQIKRKSESYAKLMLDNFPLSFKNEKLNKLLDEIVFDDEKDIFVKTLTEENKILYFKSYIYDIFLEEKEKK